MAQITLGWGSLQLVPVRNPKCHLGEDWALTPTKETANTAHAQSQLRTPRQHLPPPSHGRSQYQSLTSAQTEIPAQWFKAKAQSISLRFWELLPSSGVWDPLQELSPRSRAGSEDQNLPWSLPSPLTTPVLEKRKLLPRALQPDWEHGRTNKIVMRKTQN